jgi:hypothetical protein
MKIPNPTPLLPLPVSGSATKYEMLGYVDAHDFVLKCDYAFLAYKETNRDTGEWRVQIKSSQTDGAELDPAMIGAQSLAAAADGKTFFAWGYSLEPSAADVRRIEFRVYVVDGNPREVEIFVRLRKADHTPSAPKCLRFPWPG